MTAGLPPWMRERIQQAEREMTDRLRAASGNPALSVRFEIVEATAAPDRRATAARLLREAARLDPGLPAARLSLHAQTRRKQQAIADHYEAVGIRRALDELGLVYPNG